ncbi:head-tail adaptor protein [Mesorhizobium sp.]|uniref:phage head completion protein n=1 Tax=Mesorhizobium sp. TaxID=1871066 RepID=UPI001214B7F4|nr:head-tail adaptor protein [Mesorhizobium sp.]TIX28922.1 MAG: hypothetical protein E5V35_00755 [Mesorhizobium sp.]
MRGSVLRNPIEIQRKVQVGVDSLNAPNFVWQTWRSPLAEIEVRRGREHFDPATKQRYSEEVWRFRVRYEEVVGLDASMRLVHNGMNFNIKAPLPDGQFHRDCIIECTVQDSVLGPAPLSIAITEAIPDGVAGVAYAGFTIAAAGGTAPYVFAEESGTLPQGLTLNVSTGVVSGTPLASGVTSGIAIQVSDAVGTIASLPEFSITVT